MLAQAVEGLGADMVLNAAGILERGFSLTPIQISLRQAVMPSVGLLRDQASFGSEGDVFLLVQFQVAIAREAFDLLADRWAENCMWRAISMARTEPLVFSRMRMVSGTFQLDSGGSCAFLLEGIEPLY